MMIHPFAFLSQWRSLPSFELVSYVFMFASIPMLAYGIKPYDSSIIIIILLSILTLYSGFFAALIWNDITDAKIDSIAHPDRPIPSGRISSKKFFAVALVFSAMTFFFAFLVSIWCLALVGITALFVAFHNKYLKKSIKFPAYSEIFTPVQWVVVVIFGFFSNNDTSCSFHILC
jgi:4-hydroxybenzoate polyprenyltransferase